MIRKVRGKAITADRIKYEINISLMLNINDIISNGENPLAYNINGREITYKDMFNYYRYKNHGYDIIIKGKDFKLTKEEYYGTSNILEICKGFDRKFDVIVKGGKVRG